MDFRVRRRFGLQAFGRDRLVDNDRPPALELAAVPQRFAKAGISPLQLVENGCHIVAVRLHDMAALGELTQRYGHKDRRHSLALLCLEDCVQ